MHGLERGQFPRKSGICGYYGLGSSVRPLFPGFKLPFGGGGGGCNQEMCLGC